MKKILFILFCPVAFIGMHDHRKDILLANDFSIADL